jgi:hypothetical protein
MSFDLAADIVERKFEGSLKVRGIDSPFEGYYNLTKERESRIGCCETRLFLLEPSEIKTTRRSVLNYEREK